MKKFKDAALGCLIVLGPWLLIAGIGGTKGFWENIYELLVFVAFVAIVTAIAIAVVKKFHPREKSKK